jgi:hypothetical protein
MRKTENELKRLQHAGFYRDVDLGEPNNVLDEVEKKIAEKLGFKASTDDRYKILEMHVDIDLIGYEHKDEDGKETGIALPYVVTIEKGSNTILAIRRNWEPDDETHQKRQHFVHYGYIPGFGFYCFGLIHLIGAFAKSGTSMLRQLVDAGTLSNLPGGFKTRGLRIRGDDTPIAPGEFRDVDVPSGTMRDNILPLPYKEPSVVLAQLLDKVIQEGRAFASVSDMKVSDMSANAPVGTTLAILERTLKVMSAVQARIHYSMKREFKLLKKIIAEYTPEDYSYVPVEGSPRAKRSDYDNVEVIPVSDPNAATMAQKIVQYQAVLQLAQQSPQIYNMPLLHRQMLDVLGIKNAAKLVPMEEDEKPTDPVTENMNVLRGKPVKAFMYQDHQAHIQVHTTAMQNPKIQQILGMNPQIAQAMQAAMTAHINEHVGMEYRKQIEATLGVSIPVIDEEDDEQVLPKSVEVELSRLMAQASTKLLGQAQQEAQAQQAQQQAQDPLIQMQMQELQIKQAEQQRKATKDQVDAILKAQQIAVDQERVEAQAKNDADRNKFDALKTAAQMRDDKEKMFIKEAFEALRPEKEKKPKKGD